MKILSPEGRKNEVFSFISLLTKEEEGAEEEKNLLFQPNKYWNLFSWTTFFSKTAVYVVLS